MKISKENNGETRKAAKIINGENNNHRHRIEMKDNNENMHVGENNENRKSAKMCALERKIIIERAENGKIEAYEKLKIMKISKT